MASAPVSLADLTEYPGLPDRKGYEYLDGRWVRIPVGNESVGLAGKLFRRLADFVERNALGAVFPAEWSYQVWPDNPRRYRKPDGSFVSRERLGAAVYDEPHAHVAPDLAIEVISPGDLGSDIDQKVREYFEAGVRMVWVVYPRSRSVHVLHADGRSARLVETATLDGGDVVPGFALPLKEIFDPG